MSHVRGKKAKRKVKNVAKDFFFSSVSCPSSHHLKSPCRTLEERRQRGRCCKRSWENDVNFGVDLGGKYCIFREAMNTKTLNTSDANQNRISEKIYQRADRKGLYSLLSEYSKVRPRQSDIDESQKRKK
eukprot:349663_1